MTGGKQIPVVMLSGFLGAGKTTLLRHLLENTKLKIGCIVNDVAAVNVDAKLIRNDRSRERQGPNTTSDLADTIELSNGCACCSIQDELFMSFESLLELADRKHATYDCFVLENSGVAEPHAIRDKFSEAFLVGHPLLNRVRLDKLVTIVDSGSFSQDYASRTAVAARPDLGEGGNRRPVVDLLVEQIECADYVLLNKTDMLEGDQVSSLEAIVSSLNPLARVMPCQHGKVDIEAVFGKQSQSLVAHLNIEGHHRGAVAAAKTQQQQKEPADGHEEAQELQNNCAAQPRHDHAGDSSSAGHVHGHEKPGSHHGHAHAAHGDGHDHHDHAHDDHGHAHHGHQHDRQKTTAADRFGIKSFVYCRRQPFHPQRLRDMVLKWLPVSRNKALGDTKPDAGESPIKTVLRSKGFMWMSHSHVTAFYWSHAGQHFEIRDEGDWWAAVPDEDWPQDSAQCDIIKADFDRSSGMGDRRQEIVFIGAGMDEAAIVAQLDSALLSKDEMTKYMEHHKALVDPTHAALQAHAA